VKKEERMWYAGNLVDIAMMDFEASRILHENKLYPQAVFHFQQAVGKAVKAILVYLGLMLVIITIWLEVGTSCLKM